MDCEYCDSVPNVLIGNNCVVRIDYDGFMTVFTYGKTGKDRLKINACPVCSRMLRRNKDEKENENSY